MLPSPVRRRAALPWAASLALLGLLSALLPLLLTAPAQASPTCLQEGSTPGSCDDVKPPVFTADNITVSVSGSSATVGAQAGFSDADPDPITYQCALDNAALGPCAPYSDLAAGSHTMKVRATDSHDQPISACENPILCILYVETAPDYTDAQKQFTVTSGGTGGGGTGGGTGGTGGGGTAPGGAPETTISDGPADRLTPAQPVILSKRPTFVLSASEPATYNCAVNAQKVACQGGLNVLTKLKPGPNVLVAQAVDADGNFDTTPASLTFYVPVNLTDHMGRGWKKVRSGGAFGGDYVSTTRPGAVLTVGKVKGVHELRLIAPTGPHLGKIAIRVGKSPWMKVSLRSSKATKLSVFVVRGGSAKALSGAIQLSAASVPQGGAVAVDAIVAR